MKDQPTALVVGISGQDGAYLARQLRARGHRVVGTSRAGAPSRDHLALLGEGETEIRRLDALDGAAATAMLAELQPAEIYLLGFQSSIGNSFAAPADTMVGAITVTNMLEAVRLRSPESRVCFASSGECFGNLGACRAVEDTPFRPISPYGIAKAAASSMVRLYRERYGIFAVSAFLYNHESPLRSPTFITGKVAGFIRQAMAGQTSKLPLGDLSVVRDFGSAPEHTQAMQKMLSSPTPADYIVSTGRPTKLEDFVATLFASAGLDWRAHVTTDPALLRPADLPYSVGDPSRIARELGWRATGGLEELARWIVHAPH